VKRWKNQLFWNCRGEGVDVVFVAREARHEHHIYSLTTAVPREPLQVQNNLITVISRQMNEL
jgi:hypothetical protein